MPKISDKKKFLLLTAEDDNGKTTVLRIYPSNATRSKIAKDLGLMILEGNSTIHNTAVNKINVVESDGVVNLSEPSTHAATAE